MGNIRLAPYYLKRKCGKAYFEDDRFLSEVLDMRSKMENLMGLFEKQLEELNRQIYEDIGQLIGEQRRKAINIGRAIRKKQLKLDSVRNTDFFTKKTKEICENCMLILNEIEELKIKQKQIFEENKENSFIHIVKEVNSNYEFKNALMISVNSEFYNNIEKLGKQQDFIENKRARDAAMSIKNYYNRMIHKPSPFSTFVNVTLGMYDENNTSIEESYDYHSKISINILFLHILESLLLRDNKEFINDFYVRVNPTLTINDNSIEFLKVDTTNPKYMYYKESFTKIANNSKIDIVLKKLEDKNYHLLTLAKEIIGTVEGLDNIVQATAYILKLDSVGLLYKNFNIEYCNTDHLERLVKLCENRRNIIYDKIYISLKNICNALTTLNANCTNIELKKYYRDVIYSNINQILQMFNINSEELNFRTHNIIFENFVQQKLDSSESSLQNDMIQKLDSAAKLFRIFDNNYITKILYRDIFLQKYNSNQKIELLRFYKDVEKFSDAESVIENDSDIKRIGNMRNAFFEILRSRLNQETIEITSDDIEKIYENAPDMMRIPKSYGIYYQKCDKDFIVNNTAPGFGRHFMRYVDCLEKDEIEKFIATYKNNIDITQYGKVYDIGTNLGLNINKHISCLANAIQYPQSLCSKERYNGEREQYFISYDDEYNQLCIVDEENRRIEITPMGFIFPRVAPGYYRFLAAFSNSQGAEISFWDRFDSYYRADLKSICYPRIILDNNLVIERKTWKIPCNILKDNEKVELEEYMNLMDKLIKIYGIPKKIFAKMSMDIDGILVNNRNIKKWISNITNKKLRKPQFYDFDNYIDYKNFIRMLNIGDEIITIQEVLPGGKEIVEYLVELADLN